MSHQLENIIESIAKLPGLGRRSARRIVLHLISNRQQALVPLIKQLAVMQDQMSNCEVCGNVDITSPCAICSASNRDNTLLCIVETIADLWAIERSGNFRGKYHVLGGVLSAIDGIGPNQLSINQLLTRLQDDNWHEVIIATNPTIDGRTTAHYLTDLLKSFSIKLSCLGYGIPIGGELDYLDDSTLEVAFTTRRQLQGV